MSLNVYWKEEVVGHAGFVSKPKLSKGELWEEHSIVGISIFRNTGRWYSIFGNPETDRVPAAVVNMVDEISFWDYIPSHPKREAGVYHHASAEAEVQPYSDGKGNKNQVRVIAKKMGDVVELLRMIKAGSIRPDESYEGQQNGMSRAELEANMEHLRARFDDLHNALQIVNRKVRAVHEFREGLRTSFWPFCFRNSVMERITEALNCD